MGQQVVEGAILTCSMGDAPGTLNVLPNKRFNVCGLPAANIMDHEPLVNISVFGMCSSLLNPEVAAATAAAEGVLTPMPCVPVTEMPWEPGAITTTIQGMPALVNGSTTLCAWEGLIEIDFPGQELLNEGE